MQKTIYTRQSKILQEKFAELRQQAGLSQRELAKRMNREHSFIARIELGERRVDLAEFYWLCKACEASPRETAIQIFKEFEKII